MRGPTRNVSRSKRPASPTPSWRRASRCSWPFASSRSSTGLRLPSPTPGSGAPRSSRRRARQLRAPARGHPLPGQPRQHRLYAVTQHAARSSACRWCWRSLLNRGVALRTFLRSAFFFPFTLSVVTLGLIWPGCSTRWSGRSTTTCAALGFARPLLARRHRRPRCGRSS